MKERKLRSDAENRRKIILEKAASLFARYGIEHVSMRQIAREAGVGQGTLYRSYANKGDLCWDLIGDACLQNVNRIRDYLSTYANAPIRKRLETVLSYHLESVEKHSHLLSIVEAHTDAEQQDSFYTEHYEMIHQIFVGLLEEVTKSGFAVDMDPVFTADALMANMLPDVYLSLRNNRGYSPAQIQDQIYRIYVDPLFSAQS